MRTARALGATLTLAALLTALPGPASGTASGTASGAGAEPGPGPVDRHGVRVALRGLPDAAVSGASVRVLDRRDGRVWRLAAAGGLAELTEGRAMPRDGRLRVGSVTKAFTAVVVLQLAGEGRLDLDAPVQRYLPRLLPPSYPPVPVGSLLDHTSGLPHSTEDAGQDDPATFVAHRFDYVAPRAVVATATEHPMQFDPGAAQEYNGVNYFVAGLLVERVTGHRFARELRRRVLEPLGLDDTTLPGRRDVRLRGRHAHGYVRVDGVPVDVTAQRAYGWAESGLVSTTADLQRFLRAVLAGRLLDRAERRRLLHVPDLPYVGGECGPGAHPRACLGAGLMRTVLPGGVVVWGKSGSVGGTSAGVFATRDGARVLGYETHPLGHRDGSDGDLLQALVVGAFGLTRSRGH